MNDYLVTTATSLSVTDALDRIEDGLREKGITIFARINHGKAAQEAGLTMQEEEVLIFGNPKVGTALMLECPAIGIELPLKIAAWREGRQTIVAYQDLDKLGQMYGLKENNFTIVALKKVMETLVNAGLGK